MLARHFAARSLADFRDYPDLRTSLVFAILFLEPISPEQPSPPLADLRSAYRRPEFVVPDTVTSYSPARTDVPAVVDVSAVARAAS